MSKLATGTSLAVLGVLIGALAATSAERIAGPISDAMLISHAESAVKQMFVHPELIRFESESTRVVEHENERFVCGWLNLGPSGPNGMYRHPRRAFAYRSAAAGPKCWRIIRLRKSRRCATRATRVASAVSGFTVSQTGIELRLKNEVSHSDSTRWRPSPLGNCARRMYFARQGWDGGGSALAGGELTVMGC